MRRSVSNKGWIVLAASALALTGCGEADRDFATVIHRDPGTVAAELANIDSSEASRLMPEAQVLRSQPRENLLLYTIPGDRPEKAATILFALQPEDGADNTRISVRIHIPRIAVEDGKVAKLVNAETFERLLRTAVGQLGTALEHHDSAAAPRNSLAMLMVALAVTSHPDLFARLSRDPDSVANEAISRLMNGGGGGAFGEPAMRDTGMDPNPHGAGSFVSPGREGSEGTPGGIDARPMDEARGVDPNPQ
jgi:hypothetical protein